MVAFVRGRRFWPLENCTLPEKEKLLCGCSLLLLSQLLRGMDFPSGRRAFSCPRSLSSPCCKRPADLVFTDQKARSRPEGYAPIYDQCHWRGDGKRLECSTWKTNEPGGGVRERSCPILWKTIEAEGKGRLVPRAAKCILSTEWIASLDLS